MHILTHVSVFFLLHSKFNLRCGHVDPRMLCWMQRVVGLAGSREGGRWREEEVAVEVRRSRGMSCERRQTEFRSSLGCCGPAFG